MGCLADVVDDVFEGQRERLRSLAYRMLGTPDDADDAVQDTWLRWDAADRAAIDNPAAWLTTVTSRICIDRLRSARHRRETYVGSWLPEPLTIVDDDPSDAVAVSESLTLGFLDILERLAPVERAVFLLHEVFETPFAEIAETVDRSEAATRQIAKRARDRVRAERTRGTAPPPERARELADAFLGAMLLGDVDGLLAQLTDDVVHVADGGPNQRAARRRVVGPDRVARLFLNLASRADETYGMEAVRVNGQPGFLVRRHGAPYMAWVPTFRNDKVCAIHAVLAPEKLARFA